MLGSFLILAVVILVVGAALLGATLVLMANFLLRPPRMTDGKAAYVLRRISPGDLNLPYEETRFNVRNERDGQLISIVGWWIPHPNAQGKCVILIHGYADGKIGVIAWAPLWHSLGYHILAIDLRAHGYSGGKFTTAGFYEQHDVNQVIDQLIAERPEATRHLVLFGVSLGAAVALATAQTRKDIDALVLECPYADYRHAVAAHAQIMQMPLPSLVPAAVRLAEWISEADFRAVRPIELLQRIESPVLVIVAADDRFVPLEDSLKFERVIRQRQVQGFPHAFWCCDDVGHVMSIVADADEYRRRIGEFLQTSLHASDR